MAVTTRKMKSALPASPSREVLKLTSRLIRRTISQHLPDPREALHSLTDGPASGGGLAMAQRLRSVPIQCSIDIAVPLEVAYEEWMKLEFLPEGIHRVEQIRRKGDRLTGRILGAMANHERWRAEIREERRCESFAWRSVSGSD